MAPGLEPLPLGVEGAAHQVAKLLIWNRGSVIRPRLDGPLAGLERGVTGHEASNESSYGTYSSGSRIGDHRQQGRGVAIAWSDAHRLCTLKP